MTAGARHLDRLDELLADRAVFGLPEREEAELDALLDAAGRQRAREAESLELAAASLELSMARCDQILPVAVRERLLKAADDFAAHRTGSPVVGRIGVGSASPAAAQSVPAASPTQPTGDIRAERAPARGVPGWGWLAAAACLMLAVAGWWPRVAGPGRGVARAAGENSPADLASQRSVLMASAPDLVQSTWSDWSLEGQGPEIAGVTGDVVFSPQRQTGFMRFKGLPKNPAGSQYQLWVVDERGLSQRVSGAIFDSHGQSELIVPIAPRITVGKPALFAITIEKPGGTWVSDMKRRVVVASVPG